VALGIGLSSGGGSTVRSTLRSGWLRQPLLLWDAVNTRWHAWVVGYGPEFQRALLESLGVGNLRRTQRLAVLLGLAVAASIGLLLALSLYLAWRQRRHVPVDAAARCFATFVARLSKLRVPPRSPTESPEAYAERAARSLPHAAAEIAAVAASYLRARYEPDPERTALAELRSRVAAFRPQRA
jgi:hypothetical protein